MDLPQRLVLHSTVMQTRVSTVMEQINSDSRLVVRIVVPLAYIRWVTRRSVSLLCTNEWLTAKSDRKGILSRFYRAASGGVSMTSVRCGGRKK